MGRGTRLGAAVALLLTGCTSGVTLSDVDGDAVRADTDRLANIDRSSLTPIALTSRERVRPAEAYAILQRLNVAAKPVCDALNGDCRVRLKLSNSRALTPSMSRNGELMLTGHLVHVLQYEDELAFVMAREIGHRIAGHGNLLSLRERIGAVAGFLLGAGLMTASAMGGVSMDHTSSQELGRATDGLAAKGRDAATLVFSQREELEADKLGLEIMNAAGYDQSAALRALELLSIETGGKDNDTNFFGTHPGLGERIAHLRVEIAALPPGPPRAISDAARVVRTHPQPAMMVWSDDLSPLK
ncbi:Peptidase family M48 [Arboricoccus pini]|uniref:Peptidase family M48 n=1 Tax=Arboricoccus pini TaxID=1963835 RepID=A0A212RD20_9PROT|nr:M48 family metalloprotease [Arboricoccus pini]SNB69981.1 Peptidase family M48 [Arboricoccus pini]